MALITILAASSAFAASYSYNWVRPTTILNSVTYLPFNISTFKGTLDHGNISSVQTVNDGHVYNVSEVSGTPAISVRANFTGVDEFNTIILRVYYAGGSGHTIDVELYDYVSNQYDHIGSFSDQSDYEYVTVDIPVDEEYKTSGGNVSLLLHHEDNGNPNHDLSIDFISLKFEVSGITLTDHGALSGLGDDDHQQYLNRDGSRPMTGNLTIIHPDCQTLMTDSTGAVICANNTQTIVSITTGYSTNYNALEKNPFNETEYLVYTYTNNTPQVGIRYNTTVGKFLVNTTGTYMVSIGAYIIGNTDEFQITINHNGKAPYTHDFYVHSAVDPVYREASIILNLKKGDEIDFLISDVTADGADLFQIIDGTTANIYSLVSAAGSTTHIDNSVTNTNTVTLILNSSTQAPVLTETGYNDSNTDYTATTDSQYILTLSNATGVSNLTMECNGYLTEDAESDWRIEIHDDRHAVLDTTKVSTSSPGAEYFLHNSWYVRGRLNAPLSDSTEIHLDMNEIVGTGTLSVTSCRLTATYG